MDNNGKDSYETGDRKAEFHVHQVGDEANEENNVGSQGTTKNSKHLYAIKESTARRGPCNTAGCRLNCLQPPWKYEKEESNDNRNKREDAERQGRSG